MAEREFGSLLRELRADARMTIEELSEASGVSVRAIGDMERGKVSSPQRRTAEALADGLKLAVQDRERFLAAVKTRPRAGALAQLPADLPVFTGRRAELREALALLDRQGQEAQAVVIGAIGGMAGVGKTALALHWAHRIADLYPDGQLWVDLRGFDRGGQVLDPGQVLGGFLRALGVADSRIPAGTDDRAALFRSKLSGRRVLVVLDNARDSEQVRPLLPATAGCLAIVTSRNQLTGLAATHGARTLTLDVWTTEEAKEALARRLGADRVAAEPEATAQILELCGHLPLAVAVVAARAAARPSFALTDVAAELREAHGTLDAFHTLDGVDPRAVFSWSYQALSPAAARLFRLLGLHPGPDLTLSAAASSSPCRRAGSVSCWTSAAPLTWSPSMRRAAGACTTCCALTPPRALRNTMAPPSADRPSTASSIICCTVRTPPTRSSIPSSPRPSSRRLRDRARSSRSFTTGSRRPPGPPVS
nr:hypothetical protein GCM10020093_001800 [Planobispora longispora]